MGMSNRELTTLERHTRSNEALAAAINSGKGKELAKENDRAEKIAGGKKKLAQADKVLADAKATAKAVARDGGREAARLIADAGGAINQTKADLTERARVLDNDRSKLDQRKEALDEQDRSGIRKREAVKKREVDAEARQMEQDARDSELRTRETKADVREAEIAKFDAWRAAAPA